MSMPPDQHAKRIQEAFSSQAPTFEDPRLNQAFTSGLEPLVAAIDPGKDELCLDVAAGTGHVSRALAPHVRAIVALDAVEDMLVQGMEQARTSGLGNIVFQRGEALALPYLDDTFDLVVTRLSLHHLSDPQRAVAEMVRVCRPGGRVVLADLVRDPEAPPPDELERIRDPSHLRVLTGDEISAALEMAGAAIVASDIEVRERPLEPWLEQSRTPAAAAAQVRERLRQELAGGAPTGLRPILREDVLHFVQLWATVTALCNGGSNRSGALSASTPRKESA
ncbi:MAG TPA: methyltransferase domain-containing protein [Solirubrobacterales bacterium]